MHTATVKTQKRIRRHHRIRARVTGTSECPRLAVYRSNTALYAQIIDDVAGVTLVSADSRGMKVAGARERARMVGSAIAERAKEKHIERVVFDRGGFLYAGTIKELADSARAAGLIF